MAKNTTSRDYNLRLKGICRKFPARSDRVDNAKCQNCVSLIMEIEKLRHQLATVIANETIDIPFSNNAVLSAANADSKSVDNSAAQGMESDKSNITSGTDGLCNSLNSDGTVVDCASNCCLFESKACGTDDSTLVVQNDGVCSLISPFDHHDCGIFKFLDIQKLESELVYSHNFNNRSVAYFGDVGYNYSGGFHPSNPLVDNSYLKNTVLPSVRNQYPCVPFNSVLVTKYLNGSQNIPFHSDDESCIEPSSTIITISLGESRNLVFRSKTDKNLDFSVPSSHGDALPMSQSSQKFIEHSIPKDLTRNARISITLRQLTVTLPSAGNPESPLPSVSAVSTPPTLMTTGVMPKSTTHSTALLSGQEFTEMNDTDHKTGSKGDKSSTIYLSSSMFAKLSEDKLSSKSQCAHVFSYPGATASRIHERFFSDERREQIHPADVRNIIIMCGTNDVDLILRSPKHLRDKLLSYGSMRPDARTLDATNNAIENLILKLHQWAPNATIRLVNLLPRESRSRNEVISNINQFISKAQDRHQFVKFISTEKDRYLFSNKSGFRKSFYFSTKGHDNVHMTMQGVIKLARHLKYHAHHNC